MKIDKTTKRKKTFLNNKIKFFNTNIITLKSIKIKSYIYTSIIEQILILLPNNTIFLKQSNIFKVPKMFEILYQKPTIRIIFITDDNLRTSRNFAISQSILYKGAIILSCKITIQFRRLLQSFVAVNSAQI